ncbi:MAG: hypothetical protein IAI50_12055 [Candidatus Eremiobacteraeota bacterium]|nr:hypothetical protein [Candidatus Eremiobacteraeota bacterium]
MATIPTTATGPSPATIALLKAEEAQFNNNFVLQTTQAMADNNNATVTAIAQSHAQESAAATAGERQVGESNAHIVA